MKTSKIFTVAILFLIAALTHAESAKRVGIFKDARSYITDGLVMTLENAGYETRIIDRKGIQDAANLDGLDVIYLPGGWNAGRWAGFLGRKNLVDFVAQGKGILAGAFRGGYARNTERPLFPQVGEIYCKVNGCGVTPVGDSQLTAGVDSYYLDNFDHMLAKVGPAGTVFMTDTGGHPVGVYGAVNGGRYIIYGAFIGINAKEAPMQGTGKTLFLNLIRWLAETPAMSPEEQAANRAAAEREFLVREKLLDYTLDRQGPDFGPGIIPQIRYELRTPLQSRAIRLRRALEFVDGTEAGAAKEALWSIDRALDQLDRNYEAVLAKAVNKIKAQTHEELVADNPFFNATAIIERVDATDKPAEDKAEIKKQIEHRDHHLNDIVSRRVAAFLYGDTYREAIFPDAALKERVSGADKVLQALRPKVEAARKAGIAAELKSDLALVPTLIKQCKSKDAELRREAAQELGRIGDKRGVKALIGLLDDKDEKTRINAILALGWLQADETVPALIEKAGSADKWDRRRATQALGQIGDARGITAVMKNIDHPDFHTRENAILALGWLKAKEAVPRLIELAQDDQRENPMQRALMIDAIRSLGHIGDERALPVLKHWAETADDFAAPRRSRNGRRVKDIYSTSISLGLQGYSELAIQEIKDGGLGEVGITQNDQLSRWHWFYGLRRNFNFLAGRALKVNSIPAVFGDEPGQLIDFLYDGGATGIHNAWGDQNEGDPEKRMKMVKIMESYDMRLIDVMPTRGTHFTWRHPYEKSTPFPNTMEKVGAELVMMHYRDTPAFQGFWTEEDYPPVPMNLGFEQWLERKYGSDYREVLNIPDDLELNKLKFVGPLKQAPDTEAACAAYLEWAGQTLMDWWREGQLFLSGFRKGCAFTFNNTVGCRFTYIDVAGRAGEYIDGHGPETYQGMGSDNDLMIELAKNGEARPALCEFYTMYSPSDDRTERGFAQHLASGESFFNFNLYQIFDIPCGWMWQWTNERWDRAKKTFTKARKIKDYLAVPESAANVALVASERSKLLFYSKSYGERVSMPRRYYQNLSGMWSALRQSQIPVDAIWTESMTPGKLRKYDALVLPDAKSLTDNEIAMLREWVKQSGVLVATGTTTLFDDSGKQRKNYALRDVFGVDYAGHAAETDPKKIDTWRWYRGKPYDKVVNEQLDREQFRNHVLRDIKPAQSIGLYRVGNPGGFLEGMNEGALCEYDMPLGYDKVKTAEAQVLASFANGDPAVTVNRFGEGLCYFWAPVYPGLCYVASGWEMTPNFKDFWPGTRELMAAMVRGGLEQKKKSLPVMVSSCPKYVFINAKQQPEKRRLMVHLLNMDTAIKRVHGINMIVRVPDTKNVKVYYPDTDTKVAYRVDGDRVMFAPRDFEVHDMVAIGY